MKICSKKIVLVFSFLILGTYSGFGQQFSTILQGRIIGKQVDSLYLHKATGDMRGEKIIIPVDNGKFTHKLTDEAKEAYEIVYPYQHDIRGAWKPVTFFVEPGAVQLSLYPEEPSKDVIEGNELNKQLVRFNEEADSKFRKLAQRISQQLQESGGQEAILLKSKIDSLKKGFVSHRIDFIKNNTTPVSYYLLYEDVQSNRFNISSSILKNSYQRHANQLPNHPYTSIIETVFHAREKIDVGNKFIDFQAPDLQGKQTQLSNLIDDKIALLNLWASWCGPCIRKSREMVPIYEKYFGEEFTIIGVAREFEDTSRLKKALEKEQFPWRNLVEIDDKHDIWRKYDIPFSGGGMFLIGREGEILAINPSAKEVRELLKRHL